MSRLLTTGEFATQSRLSLKALRLYNERGLLDPAHVDARTGYRYYGTAELDRARRIALLRGIGVPLVDIADVLALPGPQAARAVDSYWRRVEADHAARRPVDRGTHRAGTPRGIHPAQKGAGGVPIDPAGLRRRWSMARRPGPDAQRVRTGGLLPPLGHSRRRRRMC
ncbi:MerR family transcriptional regulator [Micromonospora peucetia]|uniref:MerR family transcriptional regulator n=1 Tax=Micromonospora peucetia TaxID=47871 RepID=UPI000B8621BC